MTYVIIDNTLFVTKNCRVSSSLLGSSVTYNVFLMFTVLLWFIYIADIWDPCSSVGPSYTGNQREDLLMGVFLFAECLQLTLVARGVQLGQPIYRIPWCCLLINGDRLWNVWVYNHVSEWVAIYIQIT